jgi:hypothetical protein
MDAHPLEDVGRHASPETVEKLTYVADLISYVKTLHMFWIASLLLGQLDAAWMNNTLLSLITRCMYGSHLAKWQTDSS